MLFITYIYNCKKLNKLGEHEQVYKHVYRYQYCGQDFCPPLFREWGKSNLCSCPLKLPIPGYRVL